jgi:hypothetical protein
VKKLTFRKKKDVKFPTSCRQVSFDCFLKLVNNLDVWSPFNPPPLYDCCSTSLKRMAFYCLSFLLHCLSLFCFNYCIFFTAQEYFLFVIFFYLFLIFFYSYILWLFVTVYTTKTCGGKSPFLTSCQLFDLHRIASMFRINFQLTRTLIHILLLSWPFKEK